MTKEELEDLDYKKLGPWVESIMLPLGWRKTFNGKIAHPFLDGVCLSVHVVTEPDSFSAHASIEKGAMYDSALEYVQCSYESFELESLRDPLLHMAEEGDKYFTRLLSRALAKDPEDLPRIALSGKSDIRAIAERLLAGDKEWLIGAKRYAGLSAP